MINYYYKLRHKISAIKSYLLGQSNIPKNMSKTQFFIEDQEAAYKNKKDPWCNFSGPYYRILHLHYNIALGCLEDADKNVADIGCGLGRFSELINRSGRNVVGIDTSSTAIKKATKRFPKIKFEVGDVRFWKPHDKTLFNAIFLMDCYHRMDKQDKKLALENVYNNLEDGGKVIIAYGLDEYISNRKTNVYPDLSDEIFQIFKPLQIIRRQAIDQEQGTDNANRLYVGIK